MNLNGEAAPLHKELSRLIHSIYLSLKSKPIFNYLEQLLESQYYPIEKLRNMQADRLKRVVRHAYQNTEYYKKAFDRANIKLNRITTLEDLRFLPILSKETVRNHLNDLIAQDHDRPTYFTYTSGSTGQPMKFLRDSEAAAWYWAAEYRGPVWHGWEVGDKYGYFWGVHHTVSKKNKDKLGDLLLNRIRFSAHDFSEERATSFYQKCLEFKPLYFWGYPSSIYNFSKKLYDLGLDGRSLNLKFIKTSSEMLYEFQREMLEESFGCTVYNDYGACEVGHIGFECPLGGMHLSIENFCVEILNNNYQPVEEGESGKVVLTNLVNFAMPLIRYEIGDIASLSADSCPCGRSLPLLDSLEGRSCDVVIDQDGKQLHCVVLSYLIKEVAHREGLNSASQIRFIQRERNKMLVQIVKGPTFSSSLTDFLSFNVKKILGSSCIVSFDFPEEIPVEQSGKFRYFISELTTR